MSDPTSGPLEWTCRPQSRPIPSARTPDDVLARLGSRDRLICLSGAWAGGGALIAWDPVRTLAPGVGAFAALAEQPDLIDRDDDIVGGGWFGVLGFQVEADQLAFYDHLLRWDSSRGWRFESLSSAGRRPELEQAYLDAVALLGPGPPTRSGVAPLLEASPVWELGPFAAAGRSQHLAAVEQAIGLIRAGECYQANICTQFAASFTGNPVALFRQAVRTLRPDWGAIRLGPRVGSEQSALVSLSPELFLRRRGDEVVTYPIKGTARRTSTDGPDPAARRLANSAKDIAENVMIVDLMRNDLARVCQPGSVHTPSLLRVEPHSGVWHLISTVAGRVNPDTADAEVLRACFPPGSVTGAPKIRALKAISDLESHPRGAYTGALGFCSPSWGMEFSVLIRTFQISSGRARLGVGGGVTAESVPMLEWQECLDKAGPLLAAGRSGWLPATVDRRPPGRALLPPRAAAGVLETMLVVRGRVRRLDDHLARLRRSARELFGVEPDRDLRAELERAAGEMVATDRGVLRVVVRPDGAQLQAEWTCRQQTVAPGPPVRCRARIAQRSAGNWRHKWADRRELTAIEAESDAVPVFLNAQSQVTETSRGNIFLLAGDDVLLTPPLSDDLLPGVTRRAVLDAAADLGWTARITPISVHQLTNAPAFWTSSLSGLVEIEALDGVALPPVGARLTALRARL